MIFFTYWDKININKKQIVSNRYIDRGASMPSEKKRRPTGAFRIRKSQSVSYGRVKNIISEKVSDLNSLNEKMKFEISERKRAEAELEERNRLLGTLLDVSNLVSSSTMGTKQLLEDILERLSQIVDYNGAKVFIVQGDFITLFAYKCSQFPEGVQEYYMHFDAIPFGARLVSNRKPVVINDINSDDLNAASFKKTLSKYPDFAIQGTRSWMGIPMIVKDRIIGILTLDHKETGFYKKHHADLGQAFANQAALEYENARLYNETTKKADELKTMFAVQQAITSRLELDSVLQLIADESRRLTNSVSTAVLLVEGLDLVFSVFSGEDYSKMTGKRLPIGNSLLGRYLTLGKSVIFKNEQGALDGHVGIISEAGDRTYLIVPLLAGKKPVGIILAISKKTDEFHQEDERILNMFASSAVIGIENARMYEDEKRRHMEDKQKRHVAEGLRDILAILNSNRNLDEILDFIICEAVRLMGTDSGALYRLQKEDDVLTLEAACGLPSEFLSNTSVPVGLGPISKAVIEKKPVVINDICGFLENNSDENGLNPQLAWLGVNCSGLLAVPLLSKDEVYGGIALFFKKQVDMPVKKRFFSKEEVGLAVAFADQATLAIDNARLKAQAEEIAVNAERSRLARDLHDAVTQTLFSASLIAEVLPRIWAKNPEDGRQRLEELRQLARGALAEMRTLLLELRPATLVEAPLEELLRHLAEATTGRARIPVTLKIEGHAVLPTEVKIAFYRIAQEALNNIAKHSGASSAALTLNVDGSDECREVSLTVRDDGRGFDPYAVTGEHLGLGIMRERADSICACLTVCSRVGDGTDISINWKIIQ